MNAPHVAEIRLSAGQRVMLILLTGYKVLLSQLFAGSCRFVPSCSEYARDAVIQHGAVRGFWLAARRLARCHPAGSYGIDPVPLGASPPRIPRADRATRAKQRRVVSARP